MDAEIIVDIHFQTAFERAAFIFVILARIAYYCNMDVYEKLKRKLKELRHSLEITQEVLSEEIKIPRANLARYETGENIPPLDILVRIADFYDVSLDELLGRKEI